jgi:hypothetical protein
MTWVVAVM